MRKRRSWYKVYEPSLNRKKVAVNFVLLPMKFLVGKEWSCDTRHVSLREPFTISRRPHHQEHRDNHKHCSAPWLITCCTSHPYHHEDSVAVGCLAHFFIWPVLTHLRTTSTRTHIRTRPVDEGLFAYREEGHPEIQELIAGQESCVHTEGLEREREAQHHSSR